MIGEKENMVSKLCKTLLISKHSFATQLFFSFIISLIFAPLSKSVFHCLFFKLILEVVIFYLLTSETKCWNFLDRLTICISSMSGWFIGRYIYSKRIRNISILKI